MGVPLIAAGHRDIGWQRSAGSASVAFDRRPIGVGWFGRDPLPRSKRSQRRRTFKPPFDSRKVDWRAVAWKRIDRQMAQFDCASLALMLGCAMDSPGGVHRLPALRTLWLRCLACPPVGDVIASPSDLPGLLSAARSAAPQLKFLEDFWPADPRLEVRFAIQGQRFRSHPGSYSDPLRALRAVVATAGAIDPFTIERFGFGLGDLVEVARRGD
jgi:hypothetical protein